MVERRLDVRVVQIGQTRARRSADRDGGEAPCDVPAVDFDVEGRQSLHDRSPRRREVAQRHQVIGKGS
jgi:hypothetical protein